MKTTESPIVVEQLLNKTKNEVWTAITDIDQMTQWYFNNIPNFKPTVGFSTQFNVQAPSRDFLHYWIVTEVIPLKKITYNWTFKDCKGSSDVSFEIFQENSKTMIKVTNKVIEDFDDDIPEFTRESCLGGWKYFINDRLKAYLS